MRIETVRQGARCPRANHHETPLSAIRAVRDARVVLACGCEVEPRPDPVLARRPRP